MRRQRSRNKKDERRTRHSGPQVLSGYRSDDGEQRDVCALAVRHVHLQRHRLCVVVDLSGALVPADSIKGRRAGERRRSRSSKAEAAAGARSTKAEAASSSRKELGAVKATGVPHRGRSSTHRMLCTESSLQLLEGLGLYQRVMAKLLAFSLSQRLARQTNVSASE